MTRRAKEIEAVEKDLEEQLDDFDNKCVRLKFYNFKSNLKRNCLLPLIYGTNSFYDALKWKLTKYFINLLNTSEKKKKILKKLWSK